MKFKWPGSQFKPHDRDVSCKIQLRAHLPVDCEAVDDYGHALLSRHLTQALEQDQNCGGLGVVQTSVVAHDNIIHQYIDVGDLVRVEWSQVGVCEGNLVSFCHKKLED